MGAHSGHPIDGVSGLGQALLGLPAGIEQTRPESFCAYALVDLLRAELYAVQHGDTDRRELYRRATPAQAWQHTLRVP